VTFPVLSDRRLAQPIPTTTAPWQYPPTAGWTWQNQGSATIESENRGIVWTQPAVAANNLIGRTRATTNPITVTALLNNVTSPSSFGGHGLGFRSATGQITHMRYVPNSNAIAVENWTNVTTFSAGIGSGGLSGCTNGY
jgi:hypothetical protein